MNILVIDDDNYHLDHITKALKDTYPNAFVLSFDQPPDIHSLTVSFELVFIDLIIGQQNGIHIAIDVHARYPQAKIVFISSHNNLIFSVQELDILCFIRKDHFAHDFAIFKRLFERYRHHNKTLTFSLAYSDRQRNHSIVIDTSDIVYVEAYNHLIRIHLYYTDYTVLYTLQQFAESVADLKQFIRAQRAYIINMDYIDHVEDQRIIMASSTGLFPINLSRHRRRQFFQYYKEYFIL